MNRFEPYYAEDTQGVHFGVPVDGRLISAHVGWRVLSGRFGAAAQGNGWVAVYLAHQEQIHRVVTRAARVNGPETVIVELQDLV